jgi:hypothetical protein
VDIFKSRDKIIAVRTQFVLVLKNPPARVSHTLIWSNKDFSYRDFWQDVRVKNP